MIIPLLDGLDLDQAVVTADALHCQRATADYVRGRGADFILPAKDNQPGLFEFLDALPWREVPVSHAATDRGHGRVTTRTIQVMDAPPDLPFPHVSQVYLIERHVTALDGSPLSDVAALGVTSLTADRAGPKTIAGLVRGQWAIESLHWLRSPGVLRLSRHVATGSSTENFCNTPPGVMLVIAAGLTPVVSGRGAWCNTCGVTTRC